ncbi:MAG TPA: ABC transporter ATP-binding protein [Candidatus Brocadiia bacterium]|nr:ABC transporter ATP-binding protein [Candidatus Brocadiia bacterium]
MRTNDLCKDYRSGPRVLRVVNRVSLSISRGEILSIIGPSGAGKSTLLHLLGALDTPTEGMIEYKNTDLMSLSQIKRAELRNREFGFVFQLYHLLPDFTALENVYIPGLVGRSFFSDRSALKKRATELLEAVGLAERSHHYPPQLSGGERQRVAIARALINKPELLLCDEPTGNLDTKTGKQIVKLLWQLHEDTGVTIVLVTHDEGLAEKAIRRIRMIDGSITE